MEESINHTPSVGAVKHANERDVAVAVQSDHTDPNDHGKVVASGRGQVARDILDVAFANNIKVRKDGSLADILAALDLDTPIPSEAIVAVAEILAKVYQANGVTPVTQMASPNESKGIL